ncbi:unnamed protein product, partial [Trichogramma brassicae]
MYTRENNSQPSMYERSMTADRQVSKLMSHRDRPFRCDRNPGVLARVGQGVNLAVERFVTVAETIADDNPDVKQDMYEACKEARVAGSTIEKLCECAIDETLMDREAVVRAAKGLLGAVTRVLLLADITVVKQLLMAKDKVARSLGRLESVSNFTEFVKAFSQFGAEMVELAHMTGDRQNDLKDERRRAQMAAARQVLERSTMMLLTSSKACLRHPDCPSAKENRDTVFCQMRRAMDLIHYVVKDGVLDCSESTYSNSQSPQQEDWDSSTVFASLKQFERLVESTRVTLLSAGCRDSLTTALDVVIERTQDFTDSAYTSHEHRENILLLCDRAKLELNALLRVGNSINFDTSSSASPNTELDQAILSVLRATRDLRQLCQTTMEQAGDLGQVTKAGQELALTIRNVALATDIERLQESSDRFHEYLEHILEVCKLLRHVALSESLQVSAKFTEINLRIYGPQVVTAAHTLSRHPTSKIAMENLEVFADMWQWLMSDVTTVAKDVLELCQNRPEKQVYMSLPRPGKHGTTSKPLKPVRLDSEEQAKIAKSGLEMKRITTEMDAETEKWQGNGTQPEHENNDIVKRAKNMSSMAFSMYQFTRGEGALKTTQDLFTQAEYFAEEANRLYKVVRQFSYQVPGGPHKKELLENLDRVPTYVQQLQFTVKNPTVGKAATFVKVDNVIQETKNLMNVISKVVTTCRAAQSSASAARDPGADHQRSVPLSSISTNFSTSPRSLPLQSLPFVRGESRRANYSSFEREYLAAARATAAGAAAASPSTDARQQLQPAEMTIAHDSVTIWISEVCRRAGPAVRRTGAETARGLTATEAVRAATAARWAPLPAAIRLSDSSGWPDGPRGTLAARGFPFCFSRLLAFPAPRCLIIRITTSRTDTGSSRDLKARSLLSYTAYKLLKVLSGLSGFSRSASLCNGQSNSCSFCRQRRPRTPSCSRAAEDGRGSGLQCDGRLRAKLTDLHFSHHTWRSRRQTRRSQTRRSIIIGQWNVHEGRKDYACDKCEKKFGHKWLLLNHQKTIHEGHKEFGCDKCEKKFGIKSTLIRHQNTVHEGRKDYACDKCEKKFEDEGNFKKHQKTAHEGHKDYACE